MLAFVHIFKTGGTTVTGLLRRNFSTRHFDTRLIQEKPAICAAQLKRAMLVYPKLQSIAGHAVRPSSDLKSVFPNVRFYTLLREPRARLISAFIFQAANNIRHGQWVANSQAEIESRFLQIVDTAATSYSKILSPKGGGAEGAIEVIETQLDFVGLVEHFDESMALLEKWIGVPGFDPHYRRLNDSERRGREEAKFKRLREQTDYLYKGTHELVAKPAIRQRIDDAVGDDTMVYGHVQANTFERMRRLYRPGAGPFKFEDPTIASDTVPSRLLRDLLGRTLVPLLARDVVAHNG
jgi:hypothetical protein